MANKTERKSLLQLKLTEVWPRVWQPTLLLSKYIDIPSMQCRNTLIFTNARRCGGDIWQEGIFFPQESENLYSPRLFISLSFSSLGLKFDPLLITFLVTAISSENKTRAFRWVEGKKSVPYLV